ncbi:hypothetical protein POSPLADRAFT_1058293 [Postia placenta MAD-698-R-SB12]|uniref:GST N-terminal domain-containing protein n=1 Tax=Postia placenta MAD-698-R-SB12 TaxID=670580 RepID=A0A1X6MUR5_9APHY|nr:hypothetical protein POSPLADRAFT_1058293 [Postia placenta MAD-698-R-SB12]OSX60114.1 hypothetical protein POSPLADRAFT_1058293 [Postia placenta MAD-698-R-SB12]
MSPPVVLYHYDLSPYAAKIKDVLALKKIPHKRVEVSWIPPRPELSEILGIPYRRIPVLTIGNDVYCDSNMIALALERRFPASEGYGTLFPPRRGTNKVDQGIMKAFSVFFIDNAVFHGATDHIPYERLTPEFIVDRSSFRGHYIDVPAIAARREEVKSTLSSYLHLLEEQLVDGRDWLFDTEGPSLADNAAYFVFYWMKDFMRSLDDLWDPVTFPRSMEWISRITTLLEDLRKENAAPFEAITGQEAAELISSSQREDLDVIGFDSVEASRLNVAKGEMVAVMPRDYGQVPTCGKLLALSREEVVIETGNASIMLRCHFPRLNFSVRPKRDFEGAAKL